MTVNGGFIGWFTVFDTVEAQ
uniref:Uncharacterized protein n=1 Tax=Mus musculus TaxID=10090 RepID=Q99JP5_MOUSE|nr:Unknown (protein for MGC:12006) [Mus musculus]